MSLERFRLGVGEAFDGAVDRGAFQQFAHELAVEDLRQLDRRHERAELRVDVDEAFVGELHQRLAHRSPADAHLRGELLLGQR